MDTKGNPLPLNKIAKMNRPCDKQAEETRRSLPPRYVPQINPEMSIGTQVYFQSQGVTNVNSLYKQIHSHTNEDTQIGYLKPKNKWTAV